MRNLTFISSEIEKIIKKNSYMNIRENDSSFLELPIFGIASAMKAKTIVELGVRDGGTTLPLLLAANSNDGILHSVDVNEDYKCPSELKDNWVFHKKDTIQFLTEWDKKNIIDLVYVDDWHSYDHVKEELKLLDAIISPKSIILLHDTMYGQWQPHYHCDLTVKHGQWANGGPYRAIAELDQNFWEFSTIPVNNGLTILRKKYSNKYNV